jgi:hypothetical protein
MATTIPIIFSLAPIPTGQSLDANQYGQLLVANLQASITANFLLGQTGGSTPPSNVGPWFNDGQWWAWNTAQSEYLPITSSPIYNSVINANMQIWQRNVTFPNIGTTQAVYTADRWVVTSNMTGGGAATVTQQVVNFPGTSQYPDTQMALRMTVTTAQLTIAAGEYFVVTQRIERGFSRPLFDNETSLSIVLQSSLAGTYCVAIRDADQTWSYVMECVITTPSVPQYFTFPTIPAMPTSTGNWGTVNTDSCYVISVSATNGSDYQDLPNIWNSENQLGTANQTNLFATIGNTLDITLVQHEPSPISNYFKFVPFDEDLRRCQRYWAKSHPMSVYPVAFNLVTNTTVLVGATVLSFASTTAPGIAAVAVGMPVFGTNISAGVTVSAVSPTTVTLSAALIGTNSSGSTITFTSGASSLGELAFIALAATQAWGVCRFPVKMRTTPNLVTWTVLGSDGRSGGVYSQSQGVTVGSITTTQTLNESGFDLISTAGSWTSPSNAIRFQYTANAEL